MIFDKQSFIKDWHSRFGDQRFCFTEKTLEFLNLPSEESAFLKELGLPISIAPFLYFAADQHHEEASVKADFLHALLPSPAYNENSIVIGSDGLGSYIVLDPAQNFAVIYLDRDESYKPVYMNSSLWQLARCLLTYNDFIKRLNRENGEDSWLDYYCNQTQLADIKKSLSDIDPACIKKGFWKQELDLFRNSN